MNLNNIIMYLIQQTKLLSVMLFILIVLVLVLSVPQLGMLACIFLGFAYKLPAYWISCPNKIKFISCAYKFLVQSCWCFISQDWLFLDYQLPCSIVSWPNNYLSWHSIFHILAYQFDFFFFSKFILSSQITSKVVDI